MPIFKTSEQYTCGHVQETLNSIHGADTQTVITETLPIPMRCLSCLCYSALDASCAREIPRSNIRDLARHVRVLRARAGATMMQAELAVLDEQVRCSTDVEEVRRAVVALAGYPEIGAFGLLT